MHTDIRLVVRLQDCAKARTSAAYVNKVTLNNVKVMAETILFVQQNGFNSVREIEKEIRKETAMRDKLDSLVQSRLAQLNEINEAIKSKPKLNELNRDKLQIEKTIRSYEKKKEYTSERIKTLETVVVNVKRFINEKKENPDLDNNQMNVKSKKSISR